jgi:hypothetical protein
VRAAVRVAAIALAVGVAAAGCSRCGREAGQSTGAAEAADAPAPAGPLPASGAPSAKADQVYRLLAGGRAVKELPERAVDEGVAFDRDLKDKLAPRAAPR